MVPPPMSLSEITTSENIIDCSISLTGKRVAVLTNIGIEVYEWDLRSKPVAASRRLASWSPVAQAISGPTTRFRQTLVQKEDIVRLLSHSSGDGSKVTTHAIEDSNENLKDTGIDLYTSDNDLNSRPCNIYTDAEHRSLWWQNATCLTCFNQSEPSSSSAVHSSSEILIVRGHEEQSVGFEDYPPENNDRPPRDAHIFSLSRKGELFASGKLLTRGCTSFVSTNAHLIFTTSQHLLKFVHIDTSDGGYRKFSHGHLLIECRI